MMMDEVFSLGFEVFSLGFGFLGSYRSSQVPKWFCQTQVDLGRLGWTWTDSNRPGWTRMDPDSFIMLFDAGLQHEFIWTFFDNLRSQTILRIKMVQKVLA